MARWARAVGLSGSSKFTRRGGAGGGLGAGLPGLVAFAVTGLAVLAAWVGMASAPAEPVAGRATTAGRPRRRVKATSRSAPRPSATSDTIQGVGSGAGVPDRLAADTAPVAAAGLGDVAAPSKPDSSPSIAGAGVAVGRGVGKAVGTASARYHRSCARRATVSVSAVSGAGGWAKP